MKAVILAGGFGTRLRPLTNSIPKPLVPLVGKPLVMHIIDKLPSCVDQVLMAVNYRRDDLQDYFDTHDVGVEVTLVDESVPLGTGGALRNLSAYIDDTFLMFNGDVVCSLELMPFFRYHQKKGGMASLSLWEVEDPRAYGVVDFQPDGRIAQFQEKPLPGEELSHLINAGIYVFEPEIIDHIKDGPVSLEREVFPYILTKGMYGYRFSGFWVDCGTRPSYLQAQKHLLEQVGTSYSISPSSITKGVEFGQNVYVGDNSILGLGTRIENSVVMQDSLIGANSQIRNSIIGPGEIIKEGSFIYDEIIKSI